jgi:5-methylcytosine-specific restriction endonuclease McrA
VAGAALSIDQLGERDGWRCHLCRRRVSRTMRSPHPRSASFDHLIPVSHGGTDAPENLRLAHRGCNSRRGNRGAVQLQLVG